MPPIDARRASATRRGRGWPGHRRTEQQSNSPLMQDRPQTVVVIGASDDPLRYSNRAIGRLLEKGHRVIPVTPKPINLPGLKVVRTISEVAEPIDTVTLYVNPTLLEALADDIVAARPRRVIFNPGTEHRVVSERLAAAGIGVMDACTLVLLGTDQF